MTMSRAAFALALAAFLAAAASPRPGGDATDTFAPDAGSPVRDPDQELIDHWDEIENLELLQNLELFDPQADDKR
ncbi:MAG TPA: hypothetical protein VMK12_30010 [Anaeromyxobacteraceae bacterium]|nr:hypothetical protein [Anaeromyxobacteraceae bacterium]